MGAKLVVRVAVALVLALLGAAPAAHAQAPYLVKDIRPGVDTAAGSYATSPVALGGVTYFVATDRGSWASEGLHGLELWRTDGTEVGIWMVKDLNPGRMEGVAWGLTVAGDHLMFMGIDGPGGQGLFFSQRWHGRGNRDRAALRRRVDVFVLAVGRGTRVLERALLLHARRRRSRRGTVAQ
ncbi:MAG: hypothetical protein HY906_27485 [Deltaproteobacteria bacterium]|nr:hypothetical protein [Deltaproteobacteria bacterium]